MATETRLMCLKCQSRRSSLTERHESHLTGLIKIVRESLTKRFNQTDSLTRVTGLSHYSAPVLSHRMWQVVLEQSPGPSGSDDVRPGRQLAAGISSGTGMDDSRGISAGSGTDYSRGISVPGQPWSAGQRCTVNNGPPITSASAADDRSAYSGRPLLVAPNQTRYRMMGGTSGTTQAGGRWARRSSLGQADPEPAGFHAHRSPPATHLRSMYLLRRYRTYNLQLYKIPTHGGAAEHPSALSHDLPARPTG